MAQLSPVPALARRFKAQLLRGETKVTAEMLRNYKSIEMMLAEQLRLTLRDIASRTAAGQNPSPSQIYQEQRFKILLAQVREQLSKYAEKTATNVASRQKELIPLALNHANGLAGMAVKEASGSKLSVAKVLSSSDWNYVNPEQIVNVVGLLQPGTPAYDDLKNIAPDAVDKLRDSLITRVSTGEQPEQVAKAFKTELAGKAGHFLTIARTEDMRAYRMTQSQTFNENADIIGGWRWFASLSFDTCAACLSLHGQVFTTGEFMEAHPNCRCVSIPVVNGMPMEKWQTGEEWLKSQPEDIQRRALGPSKFEAFSNGDIGLNDLVGHRDDSRYGGMYYEQSLKAAVG